MYPRRRGATHCDDDMFSSNREVYWSSVSTASNPNYMFKLETGLERTGAALVRDAGMRPAQVMSDGAALVRDAVMRTCLSYDW